MRVFKLVKIIRLPRDLTMTFITAKNIHILLEKKTMLPMHFVISISMTYMPRIEVVSLLFLPCYVSGRLQSHGEGTLYI